LIGSGGNEPETDRKYFFIRFYKNDGRGNFTRDMGAIPQLIGNFSTIEAEDYDQDGDIDIFVGARCVPGNYGLPPQSYLLNNKEGTWMNVTPPSLANAGMVTDATWADSDGDGDKDLVLVGDWMAVTIFQNDNGVIENSISIPNSEGWWNRVEATDLDSDGNVDFVLGNWGLNTKFKASLSKPLTMFVNDFDDNGKSEFIINWYAPLDNRAYPFVSKTELTTQLPSLRKSILKYGDYANKTYDSLFSAEITSRSLAYKAYYLSNAVLWNNKGSFHLASLPVEAQVSPVFGIIVDDLDDDGKKDIWLAGNFYALKPQAGRHDASRGVLLTQVKNRVFKVTPQAGLTVHGEVRDAVLVTSGSGGDKYILVARNNDKVAVFKKKNATNPNPNN
jgi:enediyne biosynthesis protein E4